MLPLRRLVSLTLFTALSLSLGGVGGIGGIGGGIGREAYAEIAPQDVADVVTQGGLVPDSRIFVVTSLADHGEGTLREAIDSEGARLVVFGVSGVIELNSDLDIANGNITIAGETAPAPGIILHGGTLHIHASNVALSHIAVYAGSTTNPADAENRDSISVYGSVSRNNRISGVTLRNVSVGWGVDENLSLQGLTDGVRIERALVSSALRNGGHPKGNHSMNLLMGEQVGRVVIVGSILAAADQRSPRITTGNRLTFANNFVAGWGGIATHIDTSKTIHQEGAIDLIGNVYMPMTQTSCRRSAIWMDDLLPSATPQTRVHMADNILVRPEGLEKKNCAVYQDDGQPASHASLLHDTALTTLANWTLVPSSAVEPMTLAYAGSFPARRNPLDAGIIQRINEGTLIVPVSEEDVGGMPVLPALIRPVSLPVSGNRLATTDDITSIKEWLCQADKAATGLDSCAWH